MNEIRIDYLNKYFNDNSAVLICDNINRKYITGFPSSLGYLLICNKGAFLYVDGRYITAAKATVKCGVEVFLLEDIYEQLNSFIKDNGIERLLLEDSISVSRFNGFKKKICCNVECSSELCEALLFARSVKSEAEIQKTLQAQKITEIAFNEILNFIKIGVSEKEIALELDYILQKNGSQGVAFDTICVSGVNSCLPHGVPSEKLVQAGDFITMDFGAVYDGYHSDMTRTVAVSHITDEMGLVYETVLNAQEAAILSVKEDVFCKDADKAARDVIDRAGYGKYFSHSTGHGVGLEIHEYPNLSPKCDKTLKTGQIVTCEPGIYLPEKFGVRIEDMVLVKNNSFQNLTKAAKTLIIL